MSENRGRGSNKNFSMLDLNFKHSGKHFKILIKYMHGCIQFTAANMTLYTYIGIYNFY